MYSKKSESNSAEIVNIDSVLSKNTANYYDRVYQQHYAELSRFVARLVTTHSDVSDIVQSVFLRIVRQNEPQKLEQNPRAYLFTIATNLVRDSIRRQATRNEISDGHQVIDEESTCSTSPELQVQSGQRIAQLKQALDKLPRKKRDVLLLHRIHNLTCDEIAAELSLPLRSVQRYLSEALAFCQSRVR